MKKLGKILKQYQKLNLLKICITGKEWITDQKEMIWKNFRVNNLTIPFNVLYAKNEYIYPANDTNHNSNREKKKLIF